ncbi:hypothetical protein L6164_037610 [Bauhinia variegata]|uniref:Uncharacterized protein n=1 Tax=Bauhinia variegata TaxID=167791 RepID=A0ACB9KKW1_BAUVA|nr:hypothetical protein L6164_037610 [Bauhinia variegata]
MNGGSLFLPLPLLAPHFSNSKAFKIARSTLTKTQFCIMPIDCVHFICPSPRCLCYQNIWMADYLFDGSIPFLVATDVEFFTIFLLLPWLQLAIADSSPLAFVLTLS